MQRYARARALTRSDTIIYSSDNNNDNNPGLSRNRMEFILRFQRAQEVVYTLIESDEYVYLEIRNEAIIASRARNHFSPLTLPLRAFANSIFAISPKISL